MVYPNDVTIQVIEPKLTVPSMNKHQLIYSNKELIQV